MRTENRNKEKNKTGCGARATGTARLGLAPTREHPLSRNTRNRGAPKQDTPPNKGKGA